MENLENYGVKQLHYNEIKETVGGIGLFAAALIVGLIISAIDNAEDIVDGTSEGYNAY